MQSCNRIAAAGAKAIADALQENATLADMDISVSGTNAVFLAY